MAKLSNLLDRQTDRQTFNKFVFSFASCDCGAFEIEYYIDDG